ncbi:MAG: DNA repair protein RecO [Ignavibacteria bacterium]|nr:DNA repair protein RecO [Ignavibacteria bacterium]MBT8382125.1 DNA repair protein RecO [Ignavibacteria bacterium]MBT8392587.1 DNA repair protein RecO [Ignavibacteria bacterium]NNJ53811.1 DNA repair protein RecO [Ignavibacteriaceae bacterium]NNL21347.1 DNA repair protein RecO [Ignavibacteriaceae bacterium]
MSEIIKTEAVVLSKLNYGDTSSIVSLFTKEDGKFNAIAKGARSPKSKYSRIIDPVNYLSIVFYKKESREVQLISDADLINHYSIIKSDLEILKYAYAIIELVKNLMAEHEVNARLFKGLTRILSKLNSSKEKPEVLFGRFFMFILKEVGYEVQTEKCAICSRTLEKDSSYYFNFEKGLICGKCQEQAVDIYRINMELLQYFRCLKNNEPLENFSGSEPQRAIELMEKFVTYHVQGFKGIQSLKSFN